MSNTILNYHSDHILSQKLNTILGFKSRMIAVSDQVFHQNNLKILQSRFRKNNYPSTLIKQVLFKNNKNFNNKNKIDNNNKIYCTILYIVRLSYNIANIFKDEIINITFYNKKKLKHI